MPETRTAIFSKFDWILSRNDLRKPDSLIDFRGDDGVGAGSEPIVFFGAGDDEPCPMPVWVIWSPRCDKLALRLGESPRFTRTAVYHLDNGQWNRLPLPEFYPEERKTLAQNGFQERDRLIDAEFWRDNDTLVVRYFGNFTKEEEGDGFLKLIAVGFDRAGRGRVLDAVDVPGEN